MKKILLIILSFFLLVASTSAKEKEGTVNIYLFHSETCPHCREEIKFLDRIVTKYPNVNVYKIEINDPNNEDIINQVEKFYNFKVKAVPVTIIADKYYLGYSNEKSNYEIVSTIQYYAEYGYKDNLGSVFETKYLPKIMNKEDNISLSEYIKQNTDYKILFNIKSDELDLSSNEVILGLKSEFNIINILFIIILLLISYKSNIKDKILNYILYLVPYIIFKGLCILDLISIKILLMVLSLLLISIIILLIKKMYCHIIRCIPILLSVIIYIITINFFNEKLSLANKIIELNVPTTFNFIYSITIYILISLIINALIFGILMVCLNKIKIKIEK